MPSKTTIALAVAMFSVAAVAGAGAAFLYLNDGRGGPRAGDLGFTGEALIGGPFQLVGGDGAVVTEEVLDLPVNFVYFGFTNCPDFCPAELANLAEARKALAEQGVRSKTVFITVDPDRDTPEVVSEYAKFFDDGAIGLSGDAEQVRKAAAAYRVYYQLAEPDESGYYAVDHSTLVYAMDANGRFIQHFTANTSPEEIVSDLTSGR